jgi:hypothetical protein
MLGLANECNVFIYSTAFRSVHFMIIQTLCFTLYSTSMGLNTSSPLITPQSAHASRSALNRDATKYVCGEINSLEF